jgi:hypothetical protein
MSRSYQSAMVIDADIMPLLEQYLVNIVPRLSTKQYYIHEHVCEVIQLNCMHFKLVTIDKYVRLK